MKEKRNIIMTVLLFAIFVLFTVLLIFVDVKILGETGKEVGLGFVNKLVENIEYNKTIDKSSDVFLLMGIVSVIFLASLGSIQLVKRKNLFKVDKEIICFGICFAIMIVLWFVFDKLIVINYRPILVEGDIEASYPSTHIMIVTFTLLGSVHILSKYMSNHLLIKGSYLLAIIFIGITTIFRVLSGMHWISDCVGGLLLGTSIFSSYLVLLKNLPLVDNK